MNVLDFDFDLPDGLIAHYPMPERIQSRLLVLSPKTENDADIAHKTFADIESLVQPGDVLVFNDTKVVPARLFAQKQTGGKLEILFERVIDEFTFLAHVRSSKSPKVGSTLIVENDVILLMQGRQDALFILQTPNDLPVFDLLEKHGHIPLPPYIERQDETLDASRYQTVYAKRPGAAAAPTAGLHFDDELLDRLKAKGVLTAFVTLHVGAGTFQPVRVDNIHDHIMHSEWIDVNEETVKIINAARKNGGRVICVGTTSVRSLETASQSGELQAFQGDTSIFIYPGYKFKSVDGLITNFHLPKSTLLMLVSAFSGKQNILTAYNQAIKNKYRFFSYGDAMFLNPLNPIS
ncbi:MAG: S-adenosylmethionine:tRNA ribosyltransferase-isomerase [Oleiphilaceae bacterium]|jgi:S-adenosylmethionine:tRNA ribosyltransferase-isomerase